jgi:hypothetical protein
MSYTLHIDEQLQADGELVNHLRMKNYKFLLKFINASYGFNFRTDQSGAVFESCVDFCAQNAGNVDDAKQVLLRLFETFYDDLPSPVQENLAYLGDEIGYDPKRTKLEKLKQLCSEKLSIAGTGLTSMLGKVQVLMVTARNKFVRNIRLLQPQSGEHFQSVISRSMMMRQDEEFILDIPREATRSRYRPAA